MSAVKIDRQHEIDELLAKIYLDTNIKMNKKELLEFIFDISFNNYDQLIEMIKNLHTKDSIELRKKFIEEFAGCIQADDEDIDPKSIWKVDLE
ncbi:MAG: hypothetical protein INQ03_18835 [Candidatus Heimdallarchaeota archaeon]|nr:hypothetical protein [Candidatus Heimdallarchaeota archaeon]